MEIEKMSDQEFDDILRYALDGEDESLEHKVKRIAIDKIEAYVGNERFASKTIIEAVDNAYDLIDKEKEFYNPKLQEEIESVYLTAMKNLLPKDEYDKFVTKNNEAFFKMLANNKEMQKKLY